MILALQLFICKKLIKGRVCYKYLITYANYMLCILK